MGPLLGNGFQVLPAEDFFCLGFAGPRLLTGGDEAPAQRERQLEDGIERALRGVCARLEAGRPVCAVGSLALGADLAVARRALAHGAALRVWLPEPLDRFLNEADFPQASTRAEVEAVVGNARTSEVRVTSTASDRRERFYECAAQVVRDSDAVLCVRHWEPSRGRGGTEDTLALCAAHGRPVIEVRLARDARTPAEVVFPADWPLLPGAGELPFAVPEPAPTVARWKSAASSEAGRNKSLIVQTATWKVGLQLLSTVIAVLTLGQARWDVASLLLKILVILVVVGLAVWTRRRAAARRWARQRLTAECLRSWSAVRGLAGGAPWFEEVLPVEFVRFGRDLALLQGLDRAAHPVEVGDLRERYARERLASQQAYALFASRQADVRARALTSTFHVCLALTLVALFTKLGLRWSDGLAGREALDRLCSLVSILGPTLGAAAVSFVALLDLPARRDTESRLAEFIAAQARALAESSDSSDVRDVVRSTERRLVSEVGDWYARHAFRK